MSTRISKSPFLYKRVFPIIWFGMLSIFFGMSLNDWIGGRQPEALVLMIFPLVGFVFGFVLLKSLVFDLVDEVWDDGDGLIVSNRKRAIHVELTEIINVNHSVTTNPPRVTLTLRHPSELGSEIAFIPRSKAWWPFSPPPIARDLILRIDAARCRQHEPQ